MVDILENRRKISRKTHRCDLCGMQIQKGETYDYQRLIFDGTFYEFHSHCACSRVSSAIWNYVDPDDGMDEDQFQDGCQEVCQCFICPDCPKWDEEYCECVDDESYCIDKMDEFFKTHVLYKAGRKYYHTLWKCKEIEDGKN